MLTEQKYALLAPGNGSQYAGMGASVHETSAAAQRIYQQASEILGYDTRKVCFEDPKGQLNGPDMDHSVIQPMLVTTTLATLAAFDEKREQVGLPEAECGAGHSLGKLSLLVHSKALGFREGLLLSQERGRLMAPTARNAAVGLVIGLEKAAVEAALGDHGDRDDVIRVTVENGLRLLMIGGPKHQWEAAVARIEEVKKGAVRLYEGAPLSHHPWLDPVQEQFNRLIHGLTHPNLPIIDDLTGRVLEGLADVERSLRLHLKEEISWRKAVNHMVDERNITKAVEVGPSNKLKGMMRREWPTLQIATTDTAEELDQAIEMVKAA